MSLSEAPLLLSHAPAAPVCCSSRVFAVPAGERHWAYLRTAFTALARAALCGPSWRPAHLVGAPGDAAARSWPLSPASDLSGTGCADGTAFVCLALPRLLDLASGHADSAASEAASEWTPAVEERAAARLRRIVAGCDAVELRVDYLAACAEGGDDAVLGGEYIGWAG